MVSGLEGFHCNNKCSTAAILLMLLSQIYFSHLCIGLKCKTLPMLENGNVSYTPSHTLGSSTGYDLGTVATFTCDDGFRLLGNTNQTCVQSVSNTSIWDGNDEPCTCAMIETANSRIGLDLVVGTSVGAVALLLLILMAITLLMIFLIRRKLKGETLEYIDRDHMYEDPEQLNFTRPPLPDRNIHVNENQAYDKALEMKENKAYASSQAPEESEPELQIPTSENIAESELTIEVTESDMERLVLEELPGTSESGNLECLTDDNQEGDDTGDVHITNDSIGSVNGSAPGDEQNEYLTIIP